MKRIKLFTHTDLDGVSCYIILRSELPENEFDIDVEFLDIPVVNDRLTEFFNNDDHKSYYNVIVSDLSCNEAVAEQINILNGNNPYIKLYDHHETAYWLQDTYPEWATVTHDSNLCGTSLMYNYALRLKFSEDAAIIEERSHKTFVRDVALWDTWHWKDFEEFNDAENLSTLLTILGRDTFIERMLNNLSNDSIIDVWSQELIDIEKSRCDLYINNKDGEENKEILIYPIDGYDFGVVFGSEYTSKLGNTLNTRHPNLDGIIIVTDYGISFRTIHDYVNVGEIAKKFGGGGHAKAAGINFTDEHKKTLLDSFFAK